MVNDKSVPAPRPTSEGIADELRERIRTGVLGAGDRLPTQAALAEEFGVERGAVRGALQLLRADGLLTNVSKGSPPQVAERATATPATGSRSARSVLGPRLVAAFQAPRVRLDAMCLTAETLMVSLGEPLRQVFEGRSRPESVHVRILLPASDQHLDYPAPEKGWGHDTELDAALHRRNRNQLAAQQKVLEQNLMQLRVMGGIDVRTEFRSMTGTPTRKIYLLNRREALIGHYIPQRIMREVDDYDNGTPVPLCDVRGFETPMFAFASAGSPTEAAFVEAEQQMFDGLWEYVARDAGQD
ncbi:GntR family transcriptional regulator [Streptomyces sp. NPDC001904]|uniref:winged helix-turn-helix domain-containing protein n=1 Tax=Streptomyces sp. NPDC001904 TaxID=3154531 RepID=UPI00331C1DB9